MDDRRLNFGEAGQYAANLLDWWRPKLCALNDALEEGREEHWAGLLMAELSVHPPEVLTHLETLALRKGSRMPRRGKAYRLLAAVAAIMPREETSYGPQRRAPLKDWTPIAVGDGEWAHRWLRQHRELIFGAGRVPAASADPTTVDAWVEYLRGCIDETDAGRLSQLCGLCKTLAEREPETSASLELVRRAATPRSGFSYA